MRLMLITECRVIGSHTIRDSSGINQGSRKEKGAWRQVIFRFSPNLLTGDVDRVGECSGAITLTLAAAIDNDDKALWKCH